LTGGLIKFHDNVKNSALLPTVDNRGYALGFTIVPIGANGPPMAPTFNLNYTRTEQESQNDPVAFLGLRNSVDTLAGLISWNRNKMSASLNTSYSINEDKNNRVPDVHVFTTAFAFLLNPTFTTNIGPSVAFSRQENRDNGVNLNLWTYSITANLPVIWDPLMLNSQLAYTTSDSSDGQNNNSNFSGTAQLSWNLNRTWLNRGTQILALRVSYNRVIVDTPAPSQLTGLEIFGSVSFGWPFP
jgi:hypothetical protein